MRFYLRIKRRYSYEVKLFSSRKDYPACWTEYTSGVMRADVNVYELNISNLCIKKLWEF